MSGVTSPSHLEFEEVKKAPSPVAAVADRGDPGRRMSTKAGRPGDWVPGASWALAAEKYSPSVPARGSSEAASTKGSTKDRPRPIALRWGIDRRSHRLDDDNCGAPQ